MPPPAINAANVVLGYGVLWYAPAETVRPTTAMGGDLAGAWDYIGATNEGVTWGKSTDINDLFVEESQVAILSAPGTGRFSFSGNIAEVSAANLAFVMGGGTLTGTAGAETFIPSETLQTYAIVFDGKAAGVNKILRIYVPIARVVSELSVENRRAENYQMFNFEVAANCPFSDIHFQWGTAA